MGIGAKNTADNIADFMMKFHPRDIPLILQSAGEKGLLYDLTLGNWTKKGKELLQATNSQEAGTKAFELGADIGSTVAGAGLVRKAGTSLIDASKMVVKGSSKAGSIINEIKVLSENPWTKGPVVRGNIIDEALGNNLGRTFPTVDRLEDGVLTSIKSVDLTAKTYQTETGIFSILRTDINSLNKFTEARKDGVEVTLQKYSRKSFEMAIPDVALSTEQLAAINRAKEYASSLGINFRIVVVK